MKCTAEELQGQGFQCIAQTCDITKQEQIEQTVQRAVEAFGTVDILVNNGATLGGGKTTDQVDDQEFQRLINVNLRGVYLFIRQVLPIMKEKRYGKIVNVSSVAGIIGEATDPHYAAAKGGLISMSKSLQRELAPWHINVNVLAPGLTNTRMAHPWEFPEAEKRWYRVGEPEDMAAVIAFLSSDISGYFCGQILSPNGGEWM